MSDRQLEIQESVLVAKTVEKFMSLIDKEGGANKQELSYMVGCFVGMKMMARTDKAKSMLTRVMDRIEEEITRQNDEREKAQSPIH